VPCNPTGPAVLLMPETSIVIFDEITQGTPIRENAGEAYLPWHVIEVDELVFCFRGSLPALGIECGDLLIVKPRKKAATGEVVLAYSGQNAFIGRWWAKHGLRELQEIGQRIEGDLRIAGAVTVIVRQS
jgi:SOS-response transcriptional repressor LexA